MGTDASRVSSPTVQWTVMILALLYPSVLTAAYFVLLAEFPAGVQQAVYSTGKLIQFTFPAVCVLWWWRTGPGWRWPGRDGIAAGLLFGFAVLAAMLLVYALWFKPIGLQMGLAQQVWEKVEDLGIHSVPKYAATGVFYALVHSLLEEYYWRWFVFGQLQLRTPRLVAMAVSSLGFMAHHIILLATFFGWDSPWAYVFSLGVAVGGAVWAWIYATSRSLLGPWLSHLLVDAAIFLIGFDLVRQRLG